MITKKIPLERFRNKPVKVAFFSNSPTLPTGYAKVIRELTTRLNNDSRFEVIIYDENWSGPEALWQGIRVYGIPATPPLPNHSMVKGFVEVWKKTQPEVVVFLEDSFTMYNYGFEGLVSFPAKRVFYIPLDGEWIPSTGIGVIRTMDKLVAMAEFTRKELVKEGFPSEVIWHGVDLNLFHPVTLDYQQQLKKKYGFKEDDFIIFNYGRNTNIRKNNQGMIRVLTKYLKTAPSNHKALLHIMKYDIRDNNLDEYKKRHMKIEFGDESVTDRIIFSGEQKEDKEIAEMIQMSDLVISASTGEGFGLLMAEAMACAKPVIHTDYTTPHELLIDTRRGVGPRGWVVPIAITNVAGLNTAHAFVDQDKFVNIIREVIADPDEMKRRGMNGRVFVEKFLNWDYLVEEWKRVILNMV